MQTKEELQTVLQTYLDSFADFCKERNIDTAGIAIDHICYKCSSKEGYESLRALCEFDESFVYQSIISKRRISIIGFKTPLTSIYGDVWYLELSDQKPDNSQASGADHIEPIPVGISYEEMLSRFSLPDLTVEESVKPHHTTHDIRLPNGIKLRLSSYRLIDKIYKDEMALY